MNTDTENKLLYLQTEISKLKGIDLIVCDMHTTLKDLGLDSLDIVELQMSYETEYNVTLADNDTPIITIADLISLLI